MKKKRKNYIGKKIIVIMLIVFVATISIDSNFASYVFANSIKIHGIFNHKLSEDKTSAIIDLRIEETSDKEITSLTLPDQSKIEKEDFKRDDNNLLYFEFKATENEKLEYTVEYLEKNGGESTASESVTQQNVDTSEVKKEILTYEVKDIEKPKEPILQIEAKDSTYKLGEEVDFRKDITIKNEKDLDITNELNFNVLNYGGYKENTLGSYEIEYEVVHPKTQKTYHFSRNVIISGNTRAFSAPKQTDNSGYIKLSSSNATLTEPEKFDLLDTTQKTFNVLISYNPNSNTSSRKLVISVPEGFEITKYPTSSELGSATSSMKNGQLEILYNEGVSASSVFEIIIVRQHQNKTLNADYEIYKQASLGDYNGVFKMEGFDSSSSAAVFSDEFTFHIDELPTAELDVDLTKSKTRTTLNDSDVKRQDRYRDSLYYQVSYGLKNKMVKFEVIKLKIPKMVGDIKMTYSRSFYNGNTRNYNDSVYEDEDYIYVTIDPFLQYSSSILDFYMKEGVWLNSGKFGIKETDSYNMAIASNVYKESKNDMLTQFDNGDEINFGKLIFDSRKVSPISAVPVSGIKDVDAGTNKYISSDSALSMEKGYGIQSYDAIFTMPYEFKVTSLANGTTAITNTGRSISNINELVNDEWIEKIITKQDIRILNFDGKHYLSAPRINYAVREEDQDGNNFPSGKLVDIKVRLRSPDSNVSEEEIVFEQFRIIKRDKDNLLVNAMDQSNEKVFTKQRNASIFSMSLNYPLNDKEVKVYKNLKIEFKGDEMLSTVDTIYGPAYCSNAKFYFTTNLNNEERSVNYGFYDTKIPLIEGEYIKTLYMNIPSYDVYGYSTYGSAFSLRSSNAPKYSPLSNVALDNINFEGSVEVTADNSNETRLETGKTSTFYWRTFEDTIKADDKSANKVNGTTFPRDYDLGEKALAGFKISKSTTGFIYENPEFKIESDPLLLSMVRGIRSYTGGTLHYTTNKSSEVKTKVLEYGGDSSPESLGLPNDEYITSLTIKFSEFDTSTIGWSYSQIILYTDDSAPIYQSRVDGTYIGDEYKSYPVTMTISADNCETFSKTGKSVSISGLTSIKGNESISYNSDAYGKNYYPLTIINNEVTFYTGFTGISKYPDAEQTFKDAIIYAELGADVVYVSNSFQVVSAIPDASKVIVSVLKNKSKSGNTVVKFDFSNIELSHRTYPKFAFKTMVKPNALPKTGAFAMKGVYGDFYNVFKKQNGLQVGLEPARTWVEDTNDIQDNTNNKLLSGGGSGSFNILALNEMGISNTAVSKNGSGKDVDGFENDDFKQTVGISSSYDSSTKDWILYIPVPKKGSKVEYLTVENSITQKVQSKPSEHSLDLQNFLDVSLFPANSKVSYTTDENPVYSLDGTTVGNYTEDTTGINLSDVTMIKIQIPELKAQEKLYFDIDYKAQDKKGLGNQVAFGGVYYNTKLGENLEYHYKPLGTYGNLLSYTLNDYNVEGFVWEDTNEPINSIYNSTDIKKSGVKVYVVDKDGNISDTPDAITDAEGKYSLVFANHGKKELIFKTEEDLTSSPKKVYSFVEPNQGNESTSSTVDQTGKTEFTLSDKSLYQINAGIYAKRSISIDPKDITVIKGKNVIVPVSVFPTYAKITFNETEDTSIATVSADGRVTGVELGKTTATVTVPDGKGGIVTETYNIKVVPADVPTATSDPITIFQGGTYDATAGITILDSNKNPIAVTDTSKVTINTDAVNVSEPGRYPITYMIDDGYNQATFTRYIYVHGKVQLNIPNNLMKKVNENVTALNGVSASYTHINEDGTHSIKNVPVSTPTETITSNVVAKVNVPLEATVTVDGANDQTTGSYYITFNQRAVINTVNDNVTLKVGSTIDEIKQAIQASASMTTIDGTSDLTSTIDWSFLDGFDTSVERNKITGKIFVFDPDTGEKVEKQITVTISKNVIINAAKEIDLVVGDTFAPFDNVTITDGDGNDVALTADMIETSNVEVDANGKTTKRGVYEVVYQYKDKYGNAKRVKTTVNVHGQLQFDDVRTDILQNDSVEDINSSDINKNLAYYIDATGNKKVATFKLIGDVSSATVGKFTQNIAYTHPVNLKDSTFKRSVYVHGHVEIQVPSKYEVKVNTEVSTLKDVSASFEFVNDDGTIIQKDVAVTSTLGNTTTSAVPTEKTIPVAASTEVVPGLQNNATSSYIVVFNGMPSINVNNESIEVRVNATFEEIKNILNASASVQYGDVGTITDLTSQINWDEVKAIDTSVKNKEYNVKLYVTDKDGVKVEKQITIKISNEIIINLPSVNKVVGDTFDPKENVSLFDGQGNPVDLDDVTIDDSKVDMSKPGNYEVTYTYTDSLGNTSTKTNTIRVNGKLQFEGLDRIDLIEKEDTYLVKTAKAYYKDSDGNKVFVEGVYDKATLDQSIVGKNELTYSATHPVNNDKASSTKLNVFIHGDIEFHKPTDIQVAKVNSTLDPKLGVTATFDFVNDDGSITTKDVPVTSEEVTGKEVGYEDGRISAKVVIIEANETNKLGLDNAKTDTVKVGFNGLPYIEAANTIRYTGIISSKTDIINKMSASAGMKQANGTVINLTDKIDFSDVNRVILNKNGKYEITLTVTDDDGFTTFTKVNVIVEMKKPSQPNKPSEPNTPVETPKNPPKKDTTVAVSKDIPLSEAMKNGITDNFVKSYIRAYSEKNGIVNFEIISHTVRSKIGEYEATIRLEDGTELTVKLKVVDDSTKDVIQPKYGRDEDCIIHWIILLLFAGYSIYSIAAILKRRKENIDLEKSIVRIEEYDLNIEGDEQDEN